jgi:hypothetical protein
LARTQNLPRFLLEADIGGTAPGEPPPMSLFFPAESQPDQAARGKKVEPCRPGPWLKLGEDKIHLNPNAIF